LVGAGQQLLADIFRPTFQEHYEAHLGPVNTGMLGDFNENTPGCGASTLINRRA